MLAAVLAWRRPTHRSGHSDVPVLCVARGTASDPQSSCIPSALNSAPSTAIPEASCRVVRPLAPARLADSCRRVRSSSLHQLARRLAAAHVQAAFSTEAEARTKPNALSIPLLVTAGLSQRLCVYKPPPCSLNIVVVASASCTLTQRFRAAPRIPS
jgi:hypothetical protein